MDAIDDKNGVHNELGYWAQGTDTTDGRGACVQSTSLDKSEAESQIKSAFPNFKYADGTSGMSPMSAAGTNFLECQQHGYGMGSFGLPTNFTFGNIAGTSIAWKNGT